MDDELLLFPLDLRQEFFDSDTMGVLVLRANRYRWEGDEMISQRIASGDINEDTMYFIFPDSYDMRKCLCEIIEEGDWKPNMSDFRMQILGFDNGHPDVYAYRHVSFYTNDYEPIVPFRRPEWDD